MNKDNKFPPINRTPSLYWRNQKIYNTPAQGFRVIGGKNRKLIQQLNSRLSQAQECMRHKLEYVIFSKYRLYRRGKNRCKNCGVKI